MKKETWKQLIILLGVGFGALAIYEIYKVIAAGEASVSNIVMAPFNALKAVWNGITNLFSGTNSGVTGETPTQVASSYLSSIGVDQSSPFGQFYLAGANGLGAGALPLSTPVTASLPPAGPLGF